MNIFNRYKLILVLLTIFPGFILVSGCTSAQKADFYQLDEMTYASLTGIEKGSIIGVGPIQIPEYIKRPQIVTRSSAHHLNISEFHRWLEPLGDSITRMLVINLSNNLGTNRIYWLPRQDRQLPLELRIAIDIGRFDGQLGGVVSLESRWTVFDKNDKALITKVSLIKEPVNGHTYEDLVIAMNSALQQLGEEISQVAGDYL